MILLTVGTQLPFDRLSEKIDDWCGQSERDLKVFGQVGRLEADSYRPKNFEWKEMVDPNTFDDCVRSASLIVSHAGMGSIITALSERKPIIIMPRRASLGEHRNEHQVETAIRFGGRPGVFAVMSEDELPAMMDHVLAEMDKGDQEPIPPFADHQLIDAVSEFINGGSGKRSPVSLL